jgi:hypothetical protein
MRKSILAAVAAATLAVLVIPQASHAGGGPKDHQGFFLRLTAGGMYATSSFEGQVGDPPFIPLITADIDASGWGGDFTLALGGCVSENFALHGSLFSWTLSDPDVEIEGLGEGELDGSLSMNAYGGGVTYYLMPSNVYLSGNIGLGFLTIDTDSGDETSDPGFAMDLSVGKEWWVGNSWGLGLAGAFGFHSIEEASGYNVGVRFSATFN